MTRSLSFLALLFLLSACDSNDSLVLEPEASAIWVANGGNFSDQNGSVSRLPLTQSGSVRQSPVMEGFIQAAEPAGNGELLVLVNTFSGGRVDILAADGVTVRASLTDIPSPRAAVVMDNRAYVTTFAFDGSSSIITMDLASGAQLGDPIVAGAYAEGIAVVDGHLVVANAGFIGAGTTLTTVRLSDGTVGMVELGCDGPRDVVALSQGGAAVSCLGKTVYNDDFSQVLEQTNGQVVFLGSGLSVEDRVSFGTQLGSTGAGQAAAASLEHLVVLEGAANTLHRIDLATRTTVEAWTLSADGAYTGASGIAYAGGQWMVGRLARAAGGSFPDYTAEGQVLVLDSTGQTLSTYSVGPAPTHIAIATD